MKTARKQFVILIVTTGLIYTLVESLLVDSQYKTAIEILLVIGVFACSAWIGTQQYNARQKRDLENEKVEIVKGKREELLSKEEIKFLKKNMNRKMLAAIAIFLFVYSIYLLVANFFLPVLLGSWGEFLFWTLSAVILAIAAYLFGKRIIRLKQDIQLGKKIVLIGNISHWERYPYNEDDYILFIEEYRIRVEPAVFEKYAKGDAIEIHFFEPWQNALLFDKKL